MHEARCMVMRGGTSKALMFVASDLPSEDIERDRFLLRAMGSPDRRQIDGMGGADPLTSKVGVVGASLSPDTHVDYLFLQVVVDEARVDAGQNCGNILAAVAPFAIERGLVAAQDGVTEVRIRLVNTGAVAAARIRTPEGRSTYDGESRIDGVPGTAAPVLLAFEGVAGSSCGALLPTGRVLDVVEGLEVTCIDNGMPVVLVRAADLGRSGRESPAELEADGALTARIEALRRACGPAMRLGDVAKKTVPKMCLIAPAASGGAISTRTFIPHRVHEAIGVFGAVSVATACALPGSVAEGIAQVASRTGALTLEVEHPTGAFTVELELDAGPTGPVVGRCALLRTARKLMDGVVFAPEVAAEGVQLG